MNESRYQERILRVMVYIQNHLDDELALDYLAGVACFSPYHFHRIFTGITGEPVMSYVRRLRLERAAIQLRTTGRSVVHIALETGFDSHEAFTRRFHSHFGVAPSEYRGRYAMRTGSAQAIQVRITRFAAKRIAFVRHTGPYSGVGSAWARLFGWAVQRGLLVPGADYFGIPYDDPGVTAPERLRYDAAVAVPAGTPPEEDIGIQEMPARDYAITTHHGPYERLSETYLRLFGEWLPVSGREAASAPALEYALNDPRATVPDVLLTDVCLPLD